MNPMQAIAPPAPGRRFQRRHNPPPFRVTPRVLAILEALHRYGLLTSQQIARLDGGSQQKVLRILQLCFDHRLVDRPGAAQLHPLSPYFDARPLVYALSRKGAHLLADAGLEINVGIDRGTRNRRAVLIAHTITIAETLFSLHAACAAHGGLGLADHHDLLPVLPTTARERRKPFLIQTTVQPSDFPHLGRLLPAATTIGVEPDRVFSLTLPDRSGWTFGLELDRGTERVIPKSLKGTSYLRKQLAYFDAWRGGGIIAEWGPAFRAFRILTVTTSDSRIATMLDAQERVTRGAASGLFLYTTQKRLADEGALGAIWTTAKHSRVSLLDRD